MVKKVVGPVVGYVTQNSARVLVEVDEACQVNMVLRSAGGAEATQTVNAVAMRPAVLVFESLAPDTLYKINLSFGAETLNGCGTVRTFAERRAQGGRQSRIGVVSCNKIYVSKRPARKDVWEKLAGETRAGKLDVVLHLGDQVYSDNDYYKVMNGLESLDQMLKEAKDAGEDNKFGRAMKLLEGKTRAEFDAYGPQIEECFREIYRETWSWPPTAAVLANVSNVMMVDDHEIRDDWGQNPEDYDKNSSVYFVAEAGYRVTLEYQNSLMSAVLPVAETKDHFVIPDLVPSCASKVGVLAIDTRGKAFRQPTFPYTDKSEPYPFLGTAQWNDVSSALAANGSLENVDVLVLACGIPIAWLGEHLTNKVAKKINDFEGMFSATRNIKELERLLTELLAWKERKAGRRMVMIGGDVHLGAITHLYHNHKLFCEQLTSSAIANVQLTYSEALTMSFLLKLNTTGMPAGFSFSQREAEFRNNYGVVIVSQKKLQIQLLTNQPKSFRKSLEAFVGRVMAQCCCACKCGQRKLDLAD
eukprot:c12305_g1_i1.p1 GENE.c12305_g1_i1~~c12305_g1_i1.p1  ORF type:complete len:529 (-),score=122.64 c12305_g1_i1:185-1771(-)